MGQARLNLEIDVLLNLRPSLWLFRRVFRDQKMEITGLNIWENFSTMNVVQVVKY